MRKPKELPVRSQWFRAVPGGPQRQVSNYGGNYIGDVFSFKEEGDPVCVPYESLSGENLLCCVLERDRRCMRYMGQAIKHDGMCIDVVSSWIDGPDILHYVKPAHRVDDDVKRQLGEWIQYADNPPPQESASSSRKEGPRALRLQLVTDRALTQAERQGLPARCEELVLPSSTVRGNLEFLMAYNSPGLCPPGFRDSVRGICWDAGQLSLETIAQNVRTAGWEPLPALFHLIFDGTLRTDEEHVKLTAVGRHALVSWA